mgnify:CR=1 FL=1
MTIRYNADLKTGEYYDQANQYITAGDNALKSANIKADTTLLSIASGVADSLMKWKGVK